MARLEHRRLDRVQYWQGQMLRSRDFRDIEATEAQRRWWHNRAIHNAYGVRRGFGIRLVPSAGSYAMSVQPGVAYDSFSRELFLETLQTIPLPADAPAVANIRFMLLIRYCDPQHGAQSVPAEARFTEQSGGRRGTVEFVWRRSDLVSPNSGVALGELLYKSGRPVLTPFVPMRAQALAMPVVASGTTVAGYTPWEPWVVEWLLGGDRALEGTIGVQTTVDTSAAGFSDVPVYFAWIDGPLWNPDTLQLLPAIVPSLAGEAIDSFTFRLWLSAPQRLDAGDAAAAPEGRGITLVSDPNSFVSFAQQQGLRVAWVACQSIFTGQDG